MLPIMLLAWLISRKTKQKQGFELFAMFLNGCVYVNGSDLNILTWMYVCPGYLWRRTKNFLDNRLFYQFILYIKKNINAHDRVKNVLKLVERWSFNLIFYMFKGALFIAIK